MILHLKIRRVCRHTSLNPPHRQPQSLRWLGRTEDRHSFPRPSLPDSRAFSLFPERKYLRSRVRSWPDPNAPLADIPTWTVGRTEGDAPFSGELLLLTALFASIMDGLKYSLLFIRPSIILILDSTITIK